MTASPQVAAQSSSRAPGSGDHSSPKAADQSGDEAVAVSPVAGRVAAIDAFRGLTIFVMIFVNDLGTKGIPQWMRHMPADANAMTFVDVVFPAFLFIVGMSIPLAVEARRKRGESRGTIWGHALARTVSLLTMGVFMVNAETFNGDASPLSYGLWTLLLYLAIVLIWNAHPRRTTSPSKFWGTKLLGVAILLVLAWTYRGGAEAHGMRTSWWGILGLIGWSYLICFVLYELFARNLVAMVAMIPLLVLVSVGVRSDGLELPIGFQWLQYQAGHTVHATLTMSGIVVAMLLFQREPAWRRRDGEGPRPLLTLGVMAGLLFLAGYFLRPLHGVSKIYATPTWGLYSAALSCLLFAGLYWLMDIRRKTSWARFFRPAGENPLLVYILPGVVLSGLQVVGVTWLDDYFGWGVPRMLRALVLALVLVKVADVLGRHRVKLQL